MLRYTIPLVIFRFISCLSWIRIVKVLGVIHANWLRPGALGILPNIFSSKVINRWNLLDQRAVDAPSINAFKSTLCYIRDNRMGLFTD